jgi:hypothetical protein
MPKSTTFCNDILALFFNGTAIADLAENDTTTPLTSLYVSLHETDPGVGGSQLTGETDYTNYDRVAVVRTTSGWTVPSGGTLSNAAQIQFPQCGVLGATIAFVAIGTEDLPAAGKVLYAGSTNSLPVANQITPLFAIGALDVTET